MELRKNNCMSCGAALNIMYGASKIICPYCGTPYQIIDSGDAQESSCKSNFGIADNPSEVSYKIVPISAIDIINPINTSQNRPIIPDNTIGFFQGSSLTKLFLPSDTKAIIDQQMALYLSISYITGLELPLRFRMIREGYSRSFLDKRYILWEKHYHMDYEKDLLPYLDRKTEPLFNSAEAEAMTVAESHLKNRYGFSFVALPKQKYAGFEEVKSKTGILVTDAKVFNNYICHFYKESIGTVILNAEISKKLLSVQEKTYVDKLADNNVIDQIADGIARLIISIETHSQHEDNHYLEVTPDRIVCGGIRYDDENEQVNFSSVAIHYGKDYGSDTFYFKSFGMQDVNEPELRLAIQSVLVSRLISILGAAGLPYNIEHIVFEHRDYLQNRSDYSGDYPIVKITPATAVNKKYKRWV